MICSSCGREIPDGSTFCVVCGAQFTPTVPDYNQIGSTVAAGMGTDYNQVGSTVAAGMGTDYNQVGSTVAAGMTADYSQVGSTVAAGMGTADYGQIGSTVAAGMTADFSQANGNVGNTQQGVPAATPAPAAAPAKSGFNKLMIPVIALGACLLLALGGIAFLFLFFSPKYKNLQNENSNLQSENSSLESTISSKDSEISNLKSNVSSLTQERDNLQAEMEEYSVSAELYEEMINDIRNMKRPNNTYYSNRNVIVLGKGQTASIMVTLDKATSFTIRFDSDNKLCSAKWNNDWFNNNKSCTLTFTAGYDEGKTVFKFTNSETADTFEVLVYIVD
ncbi:MAG: zinc-ribbon domain-containing protein [Lachnospiraceae bacterium]|nr:zinc-ribbon domain-containing protein [Lachnospiraceae bacterium]